jgi:hypothetical protein
VDRSQCRNAPDGFVRAETAPDGPADGFVRADPAPGDLHGFVRADRAPCGRLGGFIRRISPDPPATCAAILAWLGSFVTYLAL